MSFASESHFRWPYRTALFLVALSVVVVLGFNVFILFDPHPSTIGTGVFWLAILLVLSSVGELVVLPVAIWGLWKRESERTRVNVLAVIAGVVFLLLVSLLSSEPYRRLLPHAT